MPEHPWTLTLTLVNSAGAGRNDRWIDDRRGDGATRRARLVMRRDGDHRQLRRGLEDSITRLTSGPVDGIGSVVDRILSQMFDHGRPWRERSRWTLMQVQEARRIDPYDVGAGRVVLIDPRRSVMTQTYTANDARGDSAGMPKRRVCLS